MCTRTSLLFSYEIGVRAAESLALEMQRGLGVTTNAEALADWLRRRWNVISPLAAHTIHETPGWPPQSAQEGATNSEQGSL